MCNPNLITSLKEFVCHLWRGLSYRWISHMVGEGILAKLKQTWNKKQIFTRVDNLKKDLVANPSSFRIAMSFSVVGLFQSLWILIDATLNVSSAVSPSFKGRFDTRISANVPNRVDPPSLGRGRVYKWKFCLSVCMFVRLSVITSYSFPFLSDSKLTQPLPQYPMSPINVSHARQSTGPPSQSTGPPMNRII